MLALGDKQYGCGGYQPFLQSFDPSWGRFLSKIHPVAGNHEYQPSGGTDCAPDAAGYFRYFGAAAGNAQADSAWNAGAWHMIALNGECGDVGGCDAASPQGQFLRNHLGSSECTLAYWHEPYYNGASRVSDYRYFWQTLYAAGADIVLNGHVHAYARFAPQDPDGNVNASRGIRQFIVGTGGKSQGSLPGSANVEFAASRFGVIKLRLHATSYDWQFVAVDGRSSTRALLPATERARRERVPPMSETLETTGPGAVDPRAEQHMVPMRDGVDAGDRRLPAGRRRPVAGGAGAAAVRQERALLLDAVHRAALHRPRLRVPRPGRARQVPLRGRG